MMNIFRNLKRVQFQKGKGCIPYILCLVSLVAASAPASTLVEWKSMIFGQSVGAEKNSITIDDASKAITLTAGTSDGTVGGGKVASGHDGISYYYVELDATKNFALSAKVKVNFFAKEKPDNQEAFGIMARDIVGKNLDAGVVPSNMVLVGGYRGEMQSMYRDFVKDTTGSGAKRLGTYRFGARPTNDGNSVYTLSMKKTNTGFHVTMNDNPEKIYYTPKFLEVQNSSKIYVGFFAARVASITVTDIKFTTSDVSTDPPGLPAPIEKYVPFDSVISPKYCSLLKYDFGVVANGSGKFTVKHNGAEFTGVLDKPGVFTRTIDVIKGNNTFDITFVADSSASDTVKSQHVVICKSYGTEDGTVYVSPSGTEAASGTSKDPIDIYSAFNFLQPRQTAVITEGTYGMDRQLLVERGNSGSAGKIKKVNGSGKVILDFADKVAGVAIWGDYWHISGITITKSNNCGMRVFGNYNVMENITTIANQNTGLQISGLSIESKELWPVNNLILNCESFDNKDPAENDADGFAAKLTCGEGNVFRGCIAHHNCDDGWDLYSKLETGSIGVVVIENCIAYGNGTLSNGTATKGDGNGFKLGGEGLAVKHVLRNSLSFNNKAAGVTNNSDPAIIVENTTSADNGKANFDFTVYSNVKASFVANGNISLRTAEGSNDKGIDNVKSSNNYFYKDKSSSNSEGQTITASDFKSVKVEPFKRKGDGSLKGVAFLSVKSKINAGAKIDDYSKITPGPAAAVAAPVTPAAK